MSELMPSLVDSHCHLDCIECDDKLPSIQAIVDHAHSNGIGHMLCVCISLDEFPRMINKIESLPHVSASAGNHPCDVKEKDADYDRLIECASHDSVVAIGETGLDYFHLDGDAHFQHASFAAHIQVARELNKPLIIHTRDAREDTIRLMREHRADQVSGVMHCFTESWQMAKQALDLGFYISFSGIITFKNAHELREVVKQVPMDRLLVETDSPYLAPVPYRGKQNYPGYVRYVAEEIARIKSVTIEEVAEKTTANFMTLFSIEEL